MGAYLPLKRGVHPLHARAAQSNLLVCDIPRFGFNAPISQLLTVPPYVVGSA